MDELINIDSKVLDIIIWRFKMISLLNAVVIKDQFNINNTFIEKEY
jgi:hypothetical protein